jgi:hypothetical protein
MVLYTELANVGIQKLFFFTGIVNDDRELYYILYTYFWPTLHHKHTYWVEKTVLLLCGICSFRTDKCLQFYDIMQLQLRH